MKLQVTVDGLLKVCPGCGTPYLGGAIKDHFTTDRTRRDGLSVYCRGCRKSGVGRGQK